MVIELMKIKMNKNEKNIWTFSEEWTTLKT
jgi:hypothetical protein